MTAFDPVRVREILQARQDRLKAEASGVLERKYWYAHRSLSSFFREDARTRQMDKQVHAIWDHAESLDPILSYLDARIWEGMTEAERIWSVMKDWDHPDPGPELVEDVLEVKRMVRNWRS